MMIVKSFQRQRGFAFEHHAGPRRVELGAKFRGAFLHGVKKDAVDVQRFHHFDHASRSALSSRRVPVSHGL